VTRVPWPWAFWFVPVGVAAVVVLCAVPWGSVPLEDAAPGARPSPGVPTTTTASSCNPTSNPTPSALLIPTTAPTSAVGPGGSLGATYEVAIVNFTTSASGTVVLVPSAFATFPLSGGGTKQLYVGPRSFTITGAGWSNGSLSTTTVSMPSGLAFASGGTATLSTQKIAVMGSVPYGTLRVEFRWHWTVVEPNGTSTVGAWTVPTATSGWPASLPSEFFPAPTVTLVGTNGPTVTIGTNFSATLSGFVGGRYFFLELEYPSTGKVVQAHGQTSAAGATPFNVTIPMINYDHYLAPGTYLVHIHDGCGAMLFSVSESAKFAAHASVGIVLDPSSCGKLTLNGSAYASGSTATLVPSTQAYGFTVPTCTGHPFQGWQGSGAVHVASSGQLLVSGDGTFSVYFG